MPRIDTLPKVRLGAQPNGAVISLDGYKLEDFVSQSHFYVGEKKVSKDEFNKDYRCFYLLQPMLDFYIRDSPYNILKFTIAGSPIDRMKNYIGSFGRNNNHSKHGVKLHLMIATKKSKSPYVVNSILHNLEKQMKTADFRRTHHMRKPDDRGKERFRIIDNKSLGDWIQESILNTQEAEDVHVEHSMRTRSGGGAQQNTAEIDQTNVIGQQDRSVVRTTRNAVYYRL